VLARTYRPTIFDDLIGQDSTIRILRSAFALNRIAHAFMLTGVRGVGKTTTARIIARALNCVGADGAGGPTPDPCGVCDNCRAILADRHPDVIEMDAASRTGVDDVREIIEATRFRPMQARTKVFIIDEVHMLSRNAFNALLKTLEEPPPHVKFVFATTEIRKVPVTVLSRCQRFDLRRIPIALLAAHFNKVATAEKVSVEAEALAAIARAADGSVRDGLSLLDQAIAQGDGASVTAAAVADMLGTADRGVVFDLMEAVMEGRAADALAATDRAHVRGNDLGALLGDMLELTHTLSRLKTVPDLRNSQELPEAERTRGAALADRLAIPALGRAWQMLLKGISEVEAAPDRRAAAEMVLIRLCHVRRPPGLPAACAPPWVAAAIWPLRRPLRSPPPWPHPWARPWRPKLKRRRGWRASAMCWRWPRPKGNCCCTAICCIPCTWCALRRPSSNCGRSPTRRASWPANWPRCCKRPPAYAGPLWSAPRRVPPRWRSKATMPTPRAARRRPSIRWCAPSWPPFPAPEWTPCASPALTPTGSLPRNPLPWANPKAPSSPPMTQTPRRVRQTAMAT
jgi:DNA polymerase III subunit gamma/tau